MAVQAFVFRRTEIIGKNPDRYAMKYATNMAPQKLQTQLRAWARLVVTLKPRGPKNTLYPSSKQT